MAPSARPRSVVGAVPASGVVKAQFRELYDYDLLRKESEATIYAVTPERGTLVLGSTQSMDILDPERVADVPIRRRRGGGGLVFVRPDDLWVDWWIPADDDRWRSDVHASSRMVGEWWADVLKQFVAGDVTVHDGTLEGDPAYRLVCFAGRGPGEVFVDGKKAVGVTQWRVREGIFLSTVMHAHASNDVLDYLRDVPEGLDKALDHQVLSSLTTADPEMVIKTLRGSGGPWQFRAVSLHV
jgi:lipoate---protein ligase